MRELRCQFRDVEFAIDLATRKAVLADVIHCIKNCETVEQVYIEVQKLWNSLEAIKK
jgi:hypothetical protein